MDIHEYQAKDLLSGYGVPIPTGGLAFDPQQAGQMARDLGGDVWVVKAQVHAGGRGEAGGVKVCKTPEAVAEFAADILHTRLVTKQTDDFGKQIDKVWVETGSNIEEELYVSIVLDRAEERLMVVASRSGGMDIEEVAETNPDAVHHEVIDPAHGLTPFQGRNLGYRMGLPKALIGSFVKVLTNCYRAYTELDAAMVEINPLVITAEGDLIALDAKMSFDTNAMPRQQDLLTLRDKAQEDPREAKAADHDLAYVGLDGDIGCIINGAGLAMATMDMITLAGGAPANFLDIGGGASPERVCEAFRTILTDQNVNVILVNIFAGINRCDWIAEGIVEAYRAEKLSIPIVVRLAGTNVEEGRKIIEDSGLPLVVHATLAQAADAAVNARQAMAA